MENGDEKIVLKTLQALWNHFHFKYINFCPETNK
jgi:hypothetical protein